MIDWFRSPIPRMSLRNGILSFHPCPISDFTMQVGSGDEKIIYSLKIDAWKWFDEP